MKSLFCSTDDSSASSPSADLKNTSKTETISVKKDNGNVSSNKPGEKRPFFSFFKRIKGSFSKLFSRFTKEYLLAEEGSKKSTNISLIPKKRGLGKYLEGQSRLNQVFPSAEDDQSSDSALKDSSLDDCHFVIEVERKQCEQGEDPAAPENVHLAVENEQNVLFDENAPVPLSTDDDGNCRLESIICQVPQESDFGSWPQLDNNLSAPTSIPTSLYSDPFGIRLPNSDSLLPPAEPRNLRKKCLILDLDETLIHSTFHVPIPNADFVIELRLNTGIELVYVAKRPGVDLFLESMAEHYEVAIFTASLPTVI